MLPSSRRAPGESSDPGSPEDASWVFRQLQWHSDCPGSHATLEMHPLSSAATRLPPQPRQTCRFPTALVSFVHFPPSVQPSVSARCPPSVSQSVDKHSLSRMDMLVGLRLRSQMLGVLSPLTPCSQSSHVVSQDREENRASLLPWPQLGFLPAVTLRQDTPSRPLLCPACELPWWSVGK